MRLDQIIVQNFRTLENLQVRFDGYYTAVSGQNNAGKTSLIRAIRTTFNDNNRDFFFARRDNEIKYRDDKTQWSKGDQDIIFDYHMSVSRLDDPGLFQFMEQFNDEKITGNLASLRFKTAHKANDESDCFAWVDNRELTKFASKEVRQKLKSSNLAFMHDSAGHYARIYGPGGQFHDLMFSAEELQQIESEVDKVQTKIKKISRSHKIELSDLLGHLEEKYEVDFAIPEGMFSGSIPFAVKLRDKNVDIPLNDWGSGTKNRTQIMMSILYANRIRSKSDENKITPFMIIEEPESFLHPSAQAEFGRVLIDLANELKIQTIVTTHSPYMLCQQSAASNVLLTRKIIYSKLRQTELVGVDEEN